MSKLKEFKGVTNKTYSLIKGLKILIGWCWCVNLNMTFRFQLPLFSFKN